MPTRSATTAHPHLAPEVVGVAPQSRGDGAVPERRRQQRGQGGLIPAGGVGEPPDPGLRPVELPGDQPRAEVAGQVPAQLGGQRGVVQGEQAQLAGPAQLVRRQPGGLHRRPQPRRTAAVPLVGLVDLVEGRRRGGGQAGRGEHLALAGQRPRRDGGQPGGAGEHGEGVQGRGPLGSRDGDDAGRHRLPQCPVDGGDRHAGQPDRVVGQPAAQHRVRRRRRHAGRHRDAVRARRERDQPGVPAGRLLQQREVRLVIGLPGLAQPQPLQVRVDVGQQPPVLGGQRPDRDRRHHVEHLAPGDGEHGVGQRDLAVQLPVRPDGPQLEVHRDPVRVVPDPVAAVGRSRGLLAEPGGRAAEAPPVRPQPHSGGRLPVLEVHPAADPGRRRVVVRAVVRDGGRERDRSGSVRQHRATVRRHRPPVRRPQRSTSSPRDRPREHAGGGAVDDRADPQAGRRLECRHRPARAGTEAAVAPLHLRHGEAEQNQVVVQPGDLVAHHPGAQLRSREESHVEHPFGRNGVRRRPAVVVYLGGGLGLTKSTKI